MTKRDTQKPGSDESPSLHPVFFLSVSRKSEVEYFVSSFRIMVLHSDIFVMFKKKTLYGFLLQLSCLQTERRKECQGEEGFLGVSLWVKHPLIFLLFIRFLTHSAIRFNHRFPPPTLFRKETGFMATSVLRMLIRV